MYRLIYKSESTARASWRSIGPILTASTRNNDRDGLTGVLLIGKRHFMQVLEGDGAAVSATFLRIARDPRHHDVRLISFEPTQQRLFAEWEMRGVGVFEFDPPISRTLIEKYGEEDGEIRFPEEAWRALALIQDIFHLGQVPEWRAEAQQ